MIGRLHLVTDIRPGRDTETVVAMATGAAGAHPDRVPLLLAAGAHGVAVVDAVSGAPDPRATVHQPLVVLG